MTEHKATDHQPSHRDSRNEKQIDGDELPDASAVKKIADEASYRDTDAMLRQTLRGDETQGDADDRDIVGSTDFADTPHGREETKNDKTGAANQNG